MVNVLPVGDLKEHEESTSCHCNPRVELVNGELLVVHNSYDRREIVERARELIVNSI